MISDEPVALVDQQMMSELLFSAKATQQNP
jgi:hypothetical protein